MSWQPEVDEIARRRAFAAGMGGAESVARHHDKGRLTVRERIDRLTDAGSFREVGGLTGTAIYDAEGTLERVVPSPYIMGVAKIDGRPVAIGGEDFTIRGGTSAGLARRKGGQGGFIEDVAHQYRIPLVNLIDGAGGTVTSARRRGYTVFPGVDGFERGDVARQALGLFRKAEADGVGPGDVGPPVHIVTHPAGEAEGQGGKLVPLVRPLLLCVGEKLRDDRVARVLRMGNGTHGAVMLVGQGDFGPLPADAIGRNRGAVAGGARHRFRLFGRQQESGVGGENRVELWALPLLAELGEVVLLQRFGQRCLVGIAADGGDHAFQPVRPFFQRRDFQLRDQRLEIVERHLAAFELARKLVRQLENRVELRGFDGALVEVLQALGQVCNAAHWPIPAAS